MHAIRLLGQEQIQVGERVITRLRARSDWWLLGLLLLHAPRALTREWLASQLWAESDSVQGLYNVRRALSELRKALGDAAYRIETPTPQTIRLNTEGLESDVRQFDDAIAGRCWTDAVTLYRGRLLPSCDADWVEPERTRRAEAFVEALEQAARAETDTNRRRVLLQQALAEQPLRESVVREVMLTYHHDGETARALQTYRNLRSRLASERLGEPSLSTQTLHRQILRGELPRTETMPKQGATTYTTSFFGRESEREALITLLRTPGVRLVTLMGPGGMGKTRLATEVLAASPSAFFVPLADLTDATQVPDTLRQVIAPGKPVADPLAEVIKALRSPLVVLDNAEHLALGAVLTRLLTETEATFLVTSRRTLGVAGERLFPLAPLTLPQHHGTVARLLEFPCVQLFCDRAQAVRREFEITEENAGAVATICQYTDGLPLAIELLAAHLRLLTPHALVDYLQKSGRKQLTRRSEEVAPARHQSLWHVLEASVAHLKPPVRRALSLLAVFRGGFTIEAVQAVCALPDLGVTLLTLEQLTDASLLQNTGERLTMLESVREFARDQIAPEERTTAESAHAAYFARWVADVTADQMAHQAEVLRQLDTEAENLWQALATLRQQGRTIERVALVAHLRLYLALRQPGRQILTETLADVGETDDRDATRVRETLGTVCAMQGEYAAAHMHFQHALARHRRMQDDSGILQMLVNLGALAIERKDFAPAQDLLTEALPLARQQENPRTLAILLGNLGAVLIRQRHWDAAEPYLHENLAIREQLQDTRGIAVAYDNLGSVALQRGEYPEALRLYQNSCRLYQTLGDTLGEAGAQDGWGSACVGLNEIEEAIRHFDTATRLREQAGRTLPPSDEDEVAPYRKRAYTSRVPAL